MQRREANILLHSVGWGEVPDHIENLNGYAFNVSNVGADAGHGAKRWNLCGVNGHAIDNELNGLSELTGLITI